LINRLLHHLATIYPRTDGPSIHEAQIQSGATYIRVCAPGCKAPSRSNVEPRKAPYMLDHLGLCCCVAGGRTRQPCTRELGKRMDGEVRAAKMTPEERSELTRRVAKVSYAAPHPWPHSFLLVTLHTIRGLLVQIPSSGLAPKVRPAQRVGDLHQKPFRSSTAKIRSAPKVLAVCRVLVEHHPGGK
jgi:hypothetical protein